MISIPEWPHACAQTSIGPTPERRIGDDLLFAVGEGAGRGLRLVASRAFLSSMSLGDFLRIERDDPDGSRHTVVHTHDPAFSMELAPDREAGDKIGRGLIKRVCVPNSWAGDYGKYGKLMTAAQEFFSKSFAEPVGKHELHRLRRRG